MLVALPTGLFAASFTEGMQRHRDRAPQRLEGLKTLDCDGLRSGA